MTPAAKISDQAKKPNYHEELGAVPPENNPDKLTVTVEKLQV